VLTTIKRAQGSTIPGLTVEALAIFLIFLFFLLLLQESQAGPSQRRRTRTRGRAHGLCLQEEEISHSFFFRI
jgi:hypothetical protein